MLQNFFDLGYAFLRRNFKLRYFSLNTLDSFFSRQLTSSILVIVTIFIIVIYFVKRSFLVTHNNKIIEFFQNFLTLLHFLEDVYKVFSNFKHKSGTHQHFHNLRFRNFTDVASNSVEKLKQPTLFIQHFQSAEGFVEHLFQLK